MKKALLVLIIAIVAIAGLWLLVPDNSTASVDKQATQQPEINIESNVDTFRNKNIVLCDDVLNTGKTLAFSLRPFLSIPIKKLQVAVIVDRNHPNFPMAADYVGYSLSTTLNEHIQVVLSDEEKTGVYIY